MTGVRMAVVVRGQVQGVGFRHFTVRTARALQVTGWVRNRADGAVEAVLEGPPEAVAAAVDELRRGPANGLVDALHSEKLPYTGEFDCFEVRF